MSIEEKLREKAYPQEGQGTQVILLSDAVKIAKEYANECCKLQLALVIAQCRDKFYLLGDDAVKIHYLALRRTVETAKLATEED